MLGDRPSPRSHGERTMTPFEGYARQALRSQGMGEGLADAIALCGRAPHREAFAALATSAGFDGFAYIVLASCAQPRILAHWTSTGNAWTARYAARGYHLVDPRVTLTRNRAVPVTWDGSLGEREPRAGEFLEDAGRHDVRSGI